MDWQIRTTIEERDIRFINWFLVWLGTLVHAHPQ